MYTGGGVMAEGSDSTGILLQNLIDAGCNKQTTNECISCINKEEMIPMLLSHRVTLLDTIHLSQQQIDCLDFLIHKIRKKQI